MLSGYKTYALVVLAFVVYLLPFFGVIDHDTMLQILTLVGFGSVATLRSAIK